MLEIELKFQIPEAQQKSLKQALQPDTAQSIHLQAKYFDTPERLLSKNGMALRLRKEGEDWVQTFKAAGKNHLHRIEAEVDLGICSEEPELPDLNFFAEHPEAQTLLENTLGNQVTELELQFETDVQRIYRIFNFNNAEIEVCLDQGEVRTQNDIDVIHEVEFELKQGPAESLIHFAQGWVKKYQLWLDVRSKAERGTLLALGQKASKAVHAKSIELSKEDSTDTVLRKIVANCLDQILPNLAAVAAEVADAEHTHQARVGIRRLRSALKIFSNWSDAVDPVWEENLSKLFSQLGSARDRDVVEADILPQIVQEGLITIELPSASDDSEHPAGSVVRSVMVMNTLLDLMAFAYTGSSAHENQHKSNRVKKKIKKRLEKMHQQIVHDASQFMQLEAEDRHRTRKRAKRLRYGIEFVSSLYSEKEVQHYLKQLRPVQEALGHYNDLIIAEEVFRSAAAQQPTAWYAAGWVKARQESALREAAQALEKFCTAQTFWS